MNKKVCIALVVLTLALFQLTVPTLAKLPNFPITTDGSTPIIRLSFDPPGVAVIAIEVQPPDPITPRDPIVPPDPCAPFDRDQPPDSCVPPDPIFPPDPVTPRSG